MAKVRITTPERVPWQVAEGRSTSELARAVMADGGPASAYKIREAGTEIGLEYHEDVNHLPPGAGDNIGWVQRPRRGRRRQSAARTYLRPAMNNTGMSSLAPLTARSA